MPDWLLWQQDNLVASYDRRELDFNAGFNWQITNRQELRLKLQAIGLSADARQGYRVDVGGNALPSNDPIDDFSLSNLAVQLRYRFEVAPLSYLYVVYGRGGFQQQVSDGSDEPFRDSFTLRDDEQLLVKFSYRFET